MLAVTCVGNPHVVPQLPGNRLLQVADQLFEPLQGLNLRIAFIIQQYPPLRRMC